MFDLQQIKIFESSLFSINSITALLYIVKTGRTGNQLLMKISRKIWKYLLKHQITIPAEYLPSSLNVEADWQSRNTKDPSKWKLCPKVFQQGDAQSRFVCIKAVSPTTPVLCLETFQSGHRCPTTDLGQSIPLRILPYSTSLEVSELGSNRKMLLVTPTWHS